MLGGGFDDADVAHTLRGEGFDASEDGTGRGTPLVPIAIQERAVSENPDAGPDGKGWRVRRLTPKECSRLQGFPDDWAKIEWRGKPDDQCPDGPQYKAYGNSMAVNVMAWIGERIAAVEALDE